MLEVNVKIIKCTLKTHINQEKTLREYVNCKNVFKDRINNIYLADDELEIFCLNFVISLDN